MISGLIADLINGSFEALGGFFILNHCRVLWHDKTVAGVSIISTIFFTLWGVWNLWYYPSLGQWMSFFGGAFLVVTNALWIGLMIYFGRKK